MRTDIKPKMYFDHFFEQQWDDIKHYEHALQREEVNADRVSSVKSQIFEMSLHCVIAKYSSGASIEDIRSDFIKVVAKFEQGWMDKGVTPEDDVHFDNYVLVLWLLSLGVLLDIETDDFERIVKVVDSSGRRDRLFDFFMAYKIPSRAISDRLTYPRQYGLLNDIINTKDVSSLKRYLDKEWYKSMRLGYWYDNHKSKANTFFGYWSWESGAVAKIIGLDDGLLENQQYYPYDMVHWK